MKDKDKTQDQLVNPGGQDASSQLAGERQRIVKAVLLGMRCGLEPVKGISFLTRLLLAAMVVSTVLVTVPILAGQEQPIIVGGDHNYPPADKFKLSNITTVGPPFYPRNYCFTVREGDVELLARLNEGLGIIKASGRYREIYDKWLGRLEPQGIPFSTIVRYTALVLLPLLLLLAGAGFWSWSLRKQVGQRTEELRQELAERARTEESLRLSEEKFSKAFRSSPDPIIIASLADGRYIDVNDGFLRATGYHREEIIGRTSIELGAWADPEDRDKFIRILQEQGAVRNMETRFRRKSGEIGVALISSEVLDLGGEACLLSISKDVTERKRAEEELRKHRDHLEELVAERTAELEEANAELSQYAYVVSHDVRAPLRAIRNYADFLREDLEATLDGEQKAYLDGLGRAVQEGETLVEDLLRLSRVGRRSVSIETIEVGAFLQELIASLDLSADVEVVLASDWPTLDVEPLLLRQIFQNLIDNAVKFNNSPRKCVELGWRPVGDEGLDSRTCLKP